MNTPSENIVRAIVSLVTFKIQEMTPGCQVSRRKVWIQRGLEVPESWKNQILNPVQNMLNRTSLMRLMRTKTMLRLLILKQGECSKRRYENR